MEQIGQTKFLWPIRKFVAFVWHRIIDEYINNKVINRF